MRLGLKKVNTMFEKRLLALTMAAFATWTTPIEAQEEAPADTVETVEYAEEETPKNQAELAEQWLYDIMSDIAPPGRKSYYPEGEETPEEAEARYRSIARDIVLVVFDPETQPLFKGPHGRIRTAAVVAAIMFHESSYRKHVDYGLGKYGRGDNGNSWCMMQHHIGEGRTIKWNWKHKRTIRWGDPPEEIFHGYTGPELIADRTKCISEGVKIARLSFRACSKEKLVHRLSSYASGNCQDGHPQSANRMSTAVKFMSETKAQWRAFTDRGVQLALQDAFKVRQDKLVEEREERLAGKQQKPEKAEESEKVAQSEQNPVEI